MRKYQQKSSQQEWITIVGAREHNLKNISVAIPKNALTVITGPSGSGKSSLSLDILYTEGKRRYMESLSSYARQFLGIVKKPEVDRIDGLCPAIAIEQKTVSSNPRSTVGTITEIYDYLRVLFARIGKLHCPHCKTPISAESSDDIATLLLNNFINKTITLAAPIVINRKGEFVQQLLQLYQKGHYRFIIDGKTYRFSSVHDIKKLKLGKFFKHTIDIILDCLEVSYEERNRLQENVDLSFKLAQGFCKVIIGDAHYVYSTHNTCLKCSASFPLLEPRLFSFNSPIGACHECNGLGILSGWQDQDYYTTQQLYTNSRPCHACKGQRLNAHALAITIDEVTIAQISALSITQIIEFFNKLSRSLDSYQYNIAQPLLHEISSRLHFLSEVGLNYLSLDRPAYSLSGGEGQRIRLATQIGSALSGVLYVLDEPSIGLHQKDNDRLITMLKKLRDQGNTVLVVEHDTETMIQADYVIDMGPAAGILGGKVTAFGTPAEIMKNNNSLTGAYLSGKKKIALPKKVRKPADFITLHNAQRNNLKNITVSFPLKVICCISGVSGSGKSTLIIDELVPLLQSMITQKKQPIIKSQTYVSGAENIENLVIIDQSPIGRTSRSNPATYLGIFDEIRLLFAGLPESNARGYKVGRFSFNMADGRCSACNGEGTVTISMQFLADVVMTCKDCKGKRYNQETLAITYKNKNIADILSMTALEAIEFFKSHKNIQKRLQLMCDVGLDYLTLGQVSTSLSGGEAQRIKLVHELAKRGKNTLYILDEPTTGLHTHDIAKLLEVLNNLVDKGNSMIIIEHNLDILKTADYVIDLGPDGGQAGGTLIACGTPRQITKNHRSYTGRYLSNLLSK